MGVLYTATLSNGVDLRIKIPSFDQMDSNEHAEIVEVELEITQQGDADKPAHWTPHYRPGGLLKFETSASALREFMKNLEKLI